MLQDLFFLRSSIEGVSLTTENIVFKLLYAISTPLFLGFGVIFYTRVCFTDPINCVTNASLENFNLQKAIDSYCLENTYTLRDQDPHHDTHTYYQYGGCFLVLCSILSYLPYIVWEWFENGTLQSLLQDLTSLTLLDEDGSRREIEKLISILRRNPSLWETYANANILSETLNLVVLLAMFGLGEWFLGGYFLTQCGVGVKEVFPKVAHCSWDTGTALYTGLCTMNMNYLSEKLFFFVWWWLMGVLMLTLGNLIYRGVLLRSGEFRTWTLTTSITLGPSFHLFGKSGRSESGRSMFQDKEEGEEEDSDSLLKYVPYLNQRMDYPQWFILNRIQANVPPPIFHQILQELTAAGDKDKNVKRE